MYKDAELSNKNFIGDLWKTNFRKVTMTEARLPGVM